ncbi:MAG: hopanoid-associated sugar epimerase [Janthinobacterium lividum]
MLAGARVLVTGASGFVGSAVARVAVAAGAQVRVMVRSTSPRGNLEGLPVEIVEGDMLDAASMERALHGIDVFFHVAADYRLWAPRPAEIMHANLEGTRIVMEAALRQQVRRIVYTSSVATLNLHDAQGPVDETSPANASQTIGAYKQSKVAAERLVERMVAEAALPAVIVNPSTPIGPRDIRPTPTGRVIVQAAQGKMPAFVDTGLNLVHVDDVAQGHLLAYAHGRIGERYILGGDDVSLGDMLGTIATLSGRRPPTLQLPRWPLYPIAAVAEGLARFTGREPFATLDGLRMSRYRMFFSSAKAQRELGYSARPYQDAVRDALSWFRDAQYVK